jgi:hypothetical protein
MILSVPAASGSRADARWSAAASPARSSQAVIARRVPVGRRASRAAARSASEPVARDPGKQRWPARARVAERHVSEVAPPSVERAVTPGRGTWRARSSKDAGKSPSRSAPGARDDAREDLRRSSHHVDQRIVHVGERHGGLDVIEIVKAAETLI